MNSEVKEILREFTKDARDAYYNNDIEITDRWTEEMMSDDLEE